MTLTLQRTLLDPPAQVVVRRMKFITGLCSRRHWQWQVEGCYYK